MTFEFAHNFLRKLMNLEWDQLPFLNDKQKDNFFANPHTFFIRSDDETARAIWDVLYPKPKEPAAGEVAKVVDLDVYRKAIDASRQVEPVGRRYRYWAPATPVDFEYDTGRVIPLAPGKSAEPAGIGGAWTPGYYDESPARAIN